MVTVKVDGDRGQILASEFSDNAPDALKRFMKDANPPGEAGFKWTYVDGDWHFKGECG